MNNKDTNKTKKAQGVLCGRLLRNWDIGGLITRIRNADYSSISACSLFSLGSDRW